MLSEVGIEETSDTPSDGLVLSEVGIAPELVIVGAGVSLVPNAVVIPTTIPLVGTESGIEDKKVISDVGSTALLGTFPLEAPLEAADGAETVAESSSVLVDNEGVGKTPVGKGSSPVKLDRKEGRMPVGRTPVEPDNPSGLDDTDADAEGVVCGSDDGMLSDELGMMKGPTMVVDPVEVGTLIGVEEGVGVGVRTVSGALPVGTGLDDSSGTTELKGVEGWTGEEGPGPVEALLVSCEALSPAVVALVGVKVVEGTCPVGATADVVSSGVLELVAGRMEDGIPPVGTTADVVSSGVLELVAGRTEDGIPPVGTTTGELAACELDGVSDGCLASSELDGTWISEEVVGSTMDDGRPLVEPITGGVELGGDDELWSEELGTTSEEVGVTGEGESEEPEADVAGSGLDGTPCVEPTSVFEDTISEEADCDDSDVESLVLGRLTGEGVTTIDSTSVLDGSEDEDDGCKWKNDSKKDEISDG